MLLQVHDELVLEAPPDEAEKVSKMVKREMESVHKLDVPLIVDVGIGENWRDAKKVYFGSASRAGRNSSPACQVGNCGSLATVIPIRKPNFAASSIPAKSQSS